MYLRIETIRRHRTTRALLAGAGIAGAIAATAPPTLADVLGYYYDGPPVTVHTPGSTTYTYTYTYSVPTYTPPAPPPARGPGLYLDADCELWRRLSLRSAHEKGADEGARSDRCGLLPAQAQRRNLIQSRAAVTPEPPTRSARSPSGGLTFGAR
jgi:hypothetical protein